MNTNSKSSGSGDKVPPLKLFFLGIDADVKFEGENVDAVDADDVDGAEGALRVEDIDLTFKDSVFERKEVMTGFSDEILKEAFAAPASSISSAECFTWPSVVKSDSSNRPIAELAASSVSGGG